MAVRLAYKSSSNFSQTRSASGKFFMFSAAKASETARARLVSGCKENHFYSLPFKQAEASIN